MRHPWQAVVTAEEDAPWWELVGRERLPLWFLKLACGHYVYRRARKAPRKVRCEGCMPVEVPTASRSL